MVIVCFLTPQRHEWHGTTFKAEPVSNEIKMPSPVVLALCSIVHEPYSAITIRCTKTVKLR